MNHKALSIVLTAALLANMVPAAPAFAENLDATPTTQTDVQQTNDVHNVINDDTVWKYLDDNTDPAGDATAAGYDKSAWAKADFDDSKWKEAAGSFGSKNNTGTNGAKNQLAGCYGDKEKLVLKNYPAYFFRAHVTIDDVSKIRSIVGRVQCDDSVTLFVNGVRVYGLHDENVKDDPAGNTSYSAAGKDEDVDLSITDAETLNQIKALLKNGDNIIAAEVHNSNDHSSDVLFGLNLTFSDQAAAAPSAIDKNSEWTYLDDNTDPAAGAADRTAWAQPDFDDSTWKKAAGSFGSKNNKTTNGADNMLAGCDGKNNYPAYFFRTHVNVADPSKVKALVGSLHYDDSIVVYLNGQKIYGGNDKQLTANLQYSVDGGDEKPDIRITDEETLTKIRGLLKAGDNVLAAEVHNSNATSSDIFFGLDLAFTDEVPEPQPQEEEAQTDINISMGADQTSNNLTWQSSLGTGSVTYGKYADLVYDAASKSYVFGAGAAQAAATGSDANDARMTVNKATMTNLEPDTLYAYQLTNGDKSSKIYTFKTDGQGAFSFAYVGDPQIGAGGSVESDTNGWANTLNIIKKNAVFSDAAFLFSAGDQVNSAGNEDQYDGYLNHSELTGLPMSTIVGNHDSGNAAYSQHFNIANEDKNYGATAAGADSWYVYNNVLFLNLNSNVKEPAVHKAFMEQAIAQAQKDHNIQWKVVTFHHSIYTVANHSTDSYITDANGFKNQMAPILKDLDIDVVLQGHDHVYCRTYMMDGLTPLTGDQENYEYGNGKDAAPTAVNDPKGILYVTANSGSGSKTYNIKMFDAPFSAVQNQEHIANVSKVTVSDKQFTVTTYRTSDMTQVDSFTIKRDGGDVQTIDQTDISLAVGANVDQMNLTWYVDTDRQGTVAYAKKADLVDGQMPAHAKTVQVEAGTVNKEGYHNFQTTMTDLEPDTEYAYQVINKDQKSKVYTFTTGGNDGSFSFAYVGDPQIGAGSLADKGLSGWKKTLGIIDDNKIFDDSTFLLSAGDQVNTDDSESEYDKFLNHEELNNMPLATVIGNHDSDSNAYDQHYNVPNESDTLGLTPAGGDNYFVYNHVLFLTLNANNKTVAEHKQFMEDAIAATQDQDIRWKVVNFHQSIYTVAHHSQDSYITKQGGFKDTMAPLLKDLGIDVVLQGHDHVYDRTYIMNGLTPVTQSDKYEYAKGTDQAPTAVNDPDGVLYITANSGSGSKTYDIQLFDTPFTAVMNQEHVPNVSKVTVTDDSFNITTYRTTDMTEVDNFTIKRGAQENDITLDTADHGSLTADKTAAKQGDTVTLTPAPDAGYKTTGVTVKDADGNTVEVAKNDDGTYTFTMPDKAVTVTPTFAKKSSGSSGGSSVTTYAVEKPETTSGGTVTTDKTRAVPGSKVTATVTPEDGYAVKDLKVTDKDGKTIDVTKNADGTYSFTMPSGKVTVTPVFEKKDNGGTATTGLPFKDVPSDAWYLDDLRFVFDKGLMTGTAADLFEPQTATNRAMIVSILYRMEGSPEGAKDAGFTDVAAGDWFAKAVNWAAENKIVGGFGDGTFRPNEPISREQMASILSRYTAFKGQDVSKRADLTKYTDADQIGDWAEDVVSWANAESLIKGTAADKLDPKGQTTRAQAAAIFARYSKTILK